jgi:hypothetical protein
LALCGCSANQRALKEVGDTLAKGNAAFSADDAELVADSSPFSLKLIESLIAQHPKHRGLLLAAARGCLHNGNALLQQQDAGEDGVVQSRSPQESARILYRRGRDYGLQGLALGREGWIEVLHADPRDAVAVLTDADIPLLYWTAVSWSALIGLSSDEPEARAEMSLMQAMIDRALLLDESFVQGGLHTLLVAYQRAHPGEDGKVADGGRAPFARADLFLL